MAAFLIVPQCKSNRSFRLHVRTAENTCQFHHQRRAGTIIIRRLAEALPVHVGADDVYPVHVMTRKSFGEMTRKLSLTESQKCAQLRGTCSRRKPSVASANCAQVA